LLSHLDILEEYFSNNLTCSLLRIFAGDRHTLPITRLICTDM